MDLPMQQADTDDLIELFNKASTFFASIAAKVSSDDLLYVYSLYKQSIEGPCNISKPGFFDFKGKQKWEAWKSLGDMTKETAMQCYVEKLTKLEPSWEGSKATQKSWVYVSRLMPEEETKEENKTMFDHVREQNLEKIKLYSPSDFKTCDDNKMSVLHWACDRGYEDIVKYLLQQEMDINCQDIDGQTPLHYAASCGHEVIVNLLIGSGAKIDIKDSDGIFPIDCAEEESIKSLLRLP